MFKLKKSEKLRFSMIYKMFPTYLKSAFSIIVVLILLTPGIVGYVLQLRIAAAADFAISIYGIYSLIYFILQVIFSEINNTIIKKDVEGRDINWREYGVGIVVVGFREEKDLLRRCLESIRDSNYGNIHRVIFVIDGNEESDEYMADIYKSIFNNNVVKINNLVSDLSVVDYSMFGHNDEHVCIMQPHGGKREGLYTGFKILMNNPNIKVIVTTDSDTILDKNAVKELTYQCHHEDVGAVAGQIDIWNKSESLMTNIVAHRYWLSFNLERASESFWRTVMCVAGPMACYKVDVLKSIMDEWYNQTFLGERCTFGDDRHLTNRVLLKGKKVIYTKYATGYTDTPANWSQYLRQQTRWSKSYFREFLFNMQSVHLHPLWMCYELLYNIVYFFLLMYWVIYIMYFLSVFQQLVAVLVTLGLGILKSLYGAIKSKSWGFMFFYLYSFVYFLIIIPSKITALVTLWDMRWGTRGKAANWIATYWSSILWIGTMMGGFGYTVYKNRNLDFTNERYFIAFVGWFTYVGFVIVSIIINYVCRRLKIFASDLEKEILNERNSTQILIKVKKKMKSK